MAAARRRAAELALAGVRALSSKSTAGYIPRTTVDVMAVQMMASADRRGGPAAALRPAGGVVRQFSGVAPPFVPLQVSERGDQATESIGHGGTSMPSQFEESRFSGEREVQAVPRSLEDVGGGAAAAASDDKARELHQKLSALRREKRWDELEELFLSWRAGRSETYGTYHPSLRAYSFYLQALGSRPGAKLEELRAVFDGIMVEDGVAPDVFSYARMLELAQRQILLQKRPHVDISPMYRLLNEMAAKEIPLNASCYANVIRALIHCNELAQAQRQLADMWSTVEMSHNREQPRLVEMYQRAHVGLLLALARRGEYSALEEQLMLMSQRLGGLNLPTALMLLDSIHAKQNSRKCASQLLNSVLVHLKEHQVGQHRPQPMVVDEGLVLKWLEFAAASADGDLASRAWDVLQESLVLCNRYPVEGVQQQFAPPSAYHAYIHALASSGQIRDAFRILAQLEQDYVGRPELYTPIPALNSIVQAISKSFQQVDEAYYFIEELKIGGGTVTAAMLNCIMAGCAQLSDAPRLFETYDSFAEMGVKPDVNTFNTILYGLTQTRKFRSISVALDDMRGLGIAPNSRTFKLAINGLLAGRNLRAALAVMDGAMEDGVELDVETLKVVLRWCDRAGETDRVKSVMEMIRGVHRAWGRGAPDFAQVLRTDYPWGPSLAALVKEEKRTAENGGPPAGPPSPEALSP